MLKSFRSATTLVAASIGAIGVVLVLYAWRLPPFDSSVQSTDNAYVRGQVASSARSLPAMSARLRFRTSSTSRPARSW